MEQQSKTCILCEQEAPLALLFGYQVCASCKSEIRLFQDATIERHRKARASDPLKPTYEEEVRSRLVFIEKEYIRKRIKLMHILDRLGST